jgi:hypothetical protein
MKKTAISLSLALVVALTSQFASAKEFSIEGDEWRPAPPEVTRFFEHYDPSLFSDKDRNCGPLQMLPPEKGSKVGVVIPRVPCWGAHNAPIWLVELGPTPKLLVETGGYGIWLGAKAGGYPELQVDDGSAAYYSVERWVFNGKKYIRAHREDRCAYSKPSKDGQWGRC